MVSTDAARLRTGTVAGVIAAALALLLGLAPSPASGLERRPALGSLAAPDLAALADVPSGFAETTVWSGLTNPTAIRFAPDGRVFVAEKSGLIKTFDSVDDPTPSIYADLRTQVDDFWDRGLLGLALDPNWSTRPFVYVLYTYDKDPFVATTPRWNDACPSPPGATQDGCVVSGRLARVNAAGSEQVLIEDWCQQFPSHSVGSLAFGDDGALYVSGGDGANFNTADYGQAGSPVNPCGDPPGGRGAALSPPTAEGGALRSQDVRTPGDPAGLNGSVLRVDPDTGAALPSNPNAASADANARRIVAHGFRNPFRFTVRPGTNELWIGDVGWNEWEEIDRLASPTTALRNYGWPCYEGPDRLSAFDTLNLNLCESLYAAGTNAVVAPYLAYEQHLEVTPGDGCATGSSAISGLAFDVDGSFPARYEGALFFADYGRDCIWVMLAGTDGIPDPARLELFAGGVAGPVDLQFGPGGDLYYVDLDGGTVRRIRNLSANRAPTAVATATPTSGAVPLTVTFDGTGSSDPDGSPLTYAWDLDGDGALDDSTAARPSFTYTTAGARTVRLRVTDAGGLSGTTTLTITAGDPPTATIDTPAAGTTWKVGDTIAFSGHATGSGGALPASALRWQLNLQHCDADSGVCHTHALQSFDGVASGSFPAPDHEYPSFLELKLTATDPASGLASTVTRRLDPRTVKLTVATSPPGLNVSIGTTTASSPVTREVIVGSANTITAPSPQTVAGTRYTFASWSDGGAASHEVTAPATATTITATYTGAAAPQRLVGADVVGSGTSSAVLGKAEVYRAVAVASGTASLERLFVDASSTASELVLGVYADAGGEPGALLASGRLSSVVAGAWNEVALSPGVAVSAGQSYWIALLNPSTGSGTLRWRDRAGGSGGAERTSAATLSALPSSWSTVGRFSDGPVSGYLVDAGGSPSPQPVLSVSPGSLAFSATVGGASPPGQALSVSNTGTGSLSFSASDDASWLSVSPGSGSAPGSVTVTASPAGLAAGTYRATVTITAAGASGSPKAIPVTLTIAPAAAGLVGAWSFDEASGTTALDSSGQGNPGTVSGATRTTAGRVGGALTFDGVDDWVTVADANSLDLASAMTLEAWVNPTSLGSVWRTVVLKEQTSQLAYALYASTDSGLAAGNVFIDSDLDTRASAALPTNTWTHLATTYDGTTLRLYVNGAQVASRALAGAIRTSTQPLRIGGNNVWGEWFAGRIDEVRVYNRALTAAQIAADMNAGGN